MRPHTHTHTHTPQAYGGNCTTPEAYLLGLWLHECRRVFSDKLVNYDDKGWVEKMLTDLLRENFQSDLIKQVCSH